MRHRILGVVLAALLAIASALPAIGAGPGGQSNNPRLNSLGVGVAPSGVPGSITVLPGLIGPGAVVAQGLPQPPAPAAAVTSGDTTGSTSYSYSVVSYGHSSAGAAIPAAQSPAVTVTNGPAALSSTDSITISYPNSSGAGPVAAVAMDVLKNVGGTWEVICSLVPLDPMTGAGSCVDQGQSPTVYTLPSSNATVDLVGGSPFPGLLVGGSDLGILYATRFDGPDACAQINNALAAANAIELRSAIAPPIVWANYVHGVQNCTTPLTYTGTTPFHLFLNGYFKLPASTHGGFYIPANAELEGSAIEGLTGPSLAGVPALSGAVFDYEPSSGSTPIINVAGTTNSGLDFFVMKNVQFVGNQYVTNGLWASVDSLTNGNFYNINCSGASSSSLPTSPCLYITNDQTVGGAFDRSKFDKITVAGNGWAGGALELDATYGGTEDSIIERAECFGTLNSPCVTVVNSNGLRIDASGTAANLASNIGAFTLNTATNANIQLTFDNGNCGQAGATGTSLVYLSNGKNITIANSLIQSGSGCGSNPDVVNGVLSGGNNSNVLFSHNTFQANAATNAISLVSTDGQVLLEHNSFGAGITNAVSGAAQLAVPDTISCDIPDNAALNSTWCTSIVNSAPQAFVDGLDITYNGTCTTTYPVVQMYDSSPGALTGAAVTGAAGFNNATLATLLQSQGIASGTLGFKVTTAPAGCGSALGTTHFHVVAHLVR
jgi:hypothetical protein